MIHQFVSDFLSCNCNFIIYSLYHDIVGSCVIPKGSIILLSFHNLHRDTSVWGIDAHKFNPEHFLPEKIATRHPYAYLPFSGGSRNCIGLYGTFELTGLHSPKKLFPRHKVWMDVNENNDFVVGASIQIHYRFEIWRFSNEMGHYFEIGQQAYGSNWKTSLDAWCLMMEGNSIFRNWSWITSFRFGLGQPMLFTSFFDILP